MQDLPLFHYDTADIKIDVLKQNDEALAKIRAASTDVVPQKVKDVYGEICFPGGHADRPYTFASIVLSSDGKMAFPDVPQGPVVASANMLDPAGGKTDFWVLNMLRAYSDGVIIGARTLQNEPDGTSHIFCEELAAARTAEMGMRARHPVNIAVSFDGTDVPLDHKIFSSNGLQAMVATSEAGLAFLDNALGARPHKGFGPFIAARQEDAAAIWKSMQENPETIHVIATGTADRPDSAVLLALLRQMGMQRLCIESPSYMWHLIQNKSLDEWFINYSMLFVGGNFTPGINAPFTSKKHPHTELLMLGAHKSNFIFTRQRLRYDFL